MLKRDRDRVSADFGRRFVDVDPNVATCIREATCFRGMKLGHPQQGNYSIESVWSKSRYLASPTIESHEMSPFCQGLVFIPKSPSILISKRVGCGTGCWAQICQIPGKSQRLVGQGIKEETSSTKNHIWPFLESPWAPKKNLCGGRSKGLTIRRFLWHMAGHGKAFPDLTR